MALSPLFGIAHRRILLATDTAVAIVQTTQQRQLEMVLAIVGIGLGISQIVDRTAADAILRLLSNYVPFIPAQPPDQYDRLLTLSVQFGITIAAVILLTPIVLWLSRQLVAWRRNKIS
ncbi:MAG: hypothetical protein ACPGWR_17830 [Ardenticatenaceae bacterium]